MWLCVDYFHSSNIHNERVCFMDSLKELLKLQFSPSLLPGIKETKGDLHWRICSMKCPLNKPSSKHPPGGNRDSFMKHAHASTWPMGFGQGRTPVWFHRTERQKPGLGKTQRHMAALRFAAKQHCLPLPRPLPPPTAIKNKVKVTDCGKGRWTQVGEKLQTCSLKSFH